jgi:cytochrome c oxidase subunit 2
MDSLARITNNSKQILHFDSYIKAVQDLKLGQPRLLEVDKLLVLPIYNNIRLLVSANDVLHS